MGRRRLLVPEARQALQSMKLDIVAHHLESTDQQRGGSSADHDSTHQFLVDHRDRVQEPDGGSMTTREAGTKGGAVGGEMVKRLIELAQQELAVRKNDRG